MGLMKNDQDSAGVVRYPELIAALAKQLQLPKIKVKTTIDGMVALAAQELKKGKLVQIGELGRLRVKDVVPKSGGDAQAGPASKRVVLAVAKKFREIAETK